MNKLPLQSNPRPPASLRLCVKAWLAYAAITASLILLVMCLAAFVSQFDHLASGVLGLCVFILWSGVMGCLYLFTK